MKQKVLIIVENAPVPFDLRVWKEALALSKNGYEVTVLCPRDKNYERRHEVRDGIHIYRHPMPSEGSGSFGYVWEYACALFWQFLYAWWIYLRWRFDVIQGCNPPDDIFLVAVPFKLFGVKYVFDHHDANPELYRAKFARKGVFYKILVILERLTYYFSDVVICTNGSYRDLAVTRGGVDPVDAFVVRNGPDLASFRPVSSQPALKHGKSYLVGYVGTMGTQDGLDILVDVAVHIKRMGRLDVHFTCVGGGPGLAALRKMIRDKDVEEMVNFTGRIPDDDLLAILSTADVCVNPDKPCEMNDISTMIKIMEYMALGKPIVQFESKEGRFSAGGASLYADNNNQVPDFAAKILWLLDSPSEREGMGRLGRKRVEDELAWDYSVPHLLAAYERCFNRNARSASGPLGVLDRKPANRTQGAESADHRQSDTQLLVDRFRCPRGAAEFVIDGDFSHDPGYFRIGSDAICFGRCSSGAPAKFVTDSLPDALYGVVIDSSSVHLPFDPVQVVDNLRCERYRATWPRVKALPSIHVLRSMYYAVRPALGTSVRRHLQRLYFRGWDKIPFPRWPVDTTVESIFEQLLALSMRSREVTKVPFIWFWPDGSPTCTMVTHDVETSAGLDFCSQLMNLNDSFKIKGSFQVIPEKRYPVSQSALENMQARGFEVNVHDLNHDGHLYSDHDEFTRRVARINGYGKAFGAEGFRAGALYRNLDWYGELDFAYDMSVPSAGHLEPQAGGCCTVMPYFVGELLEIPVTATQDYSLFHILQQYSIALWKSEIETLMRAHGLISFIAHPDYLIEERARSCYTELLDHLAELRSQSLVWITLPKQLNNWWRERSQMSLVHDSNGWTVTGPGSERASVAYAFLDGDRLAYRIVKPSPERILAA